MTCLLAGGHSPAAVLEEYTIDEVRVYHSAAVRKIGSDAKLLSNVCRAAYHADKAAYRRFLDALDAAGEKKRLTPGEFIRFLDKQVKGKPFKGESGG